MVVVDDCSTDDTLQLLQAFTFGSNNIRLTVVSMPENSGHQAAIYKGLVEAGLHPSGRFIIMDADGQDAPEVIAEMLTIEEADIVHIVRGKRNEPLIFRGCYFMYRMLFRLLTGQRMNYGNFCMINRKILETATDARFTHFPAFLAKQKVNKKYVASPRSNRLGGSSKMGFVKLTKHALRSFIEYWDVIKLSRLLPVIAIIFLAACG